MRNGRMRLAEFIEQNIPLILKEWEVFARSIWPDPAAVVGVAELRDDADELLRATILDMRTDQSDRQQLDKSRGTDNAEWSSVRIRRASESHGAGRSDSGFDLPALVSEYRALRASVLRLWRESSPNRSLHDLDDITRFNECLDQSLAEAVSSYAEQVGRERAAILQNEQAARRDAESANRAKDMFLATLSHELRTPLNAIAGWVTILRIGECCESDLEEGLEVIDRNTKAQLQLIEDVLDVSRIVSGKLRLELRECDLFEVINSGIDVIRPTAEARQISLEVEIDPSARRASCDVMRIQQVVWNLLSNAVKFTPKGGTVRIRLARERSGVTISVSDTGQGISQELLPFIFERFRQADNSTRRIYGGLGLGLSIVKHLTEMHGGTVEAESAGQGLGATFIVRLPVKVVMNDDDDFTEPMAATEKALPVGGLRSSSVCLSGLHILIVDDEIDARRMLCRVLNGAGARLSIAESVVGALATLAEAEVKSDLPDLIVSDIGMPGQNGYDLIREVRRLGYDSNELPAVALTAYAHKSDVDEALSSGFQTHLAKPVNISELTDVIAKLAGRTESAVSCH